MITLFRKQPELVFNLSHRCVEELINTHRNAISKLAASFNKENNISIAIDGFRQAFNEYNSSTMGDFVSFSELHIAKALILETDNENVENERQIEIKHYMKQLKKFKISLVSLSSYQITEEDKKRIFAFIKDIQSNLELKTRIFSTKRIPFKDLSFNETDIKLFKKYQPYVLAMMLLHMYEYKHLYSFLVKGHDK